MSDCNPNDPHNQSQWIVRIGVWNLVSDGASVLTVKRVKSTEVFETLKKIGNLPEVILCSVVPFGLQNFNRRRVGKSCSWNCRLVADHITRERTVTFLGAFEQSCGNVSRGKFETSCTNKGDRGDELETTLKQIQLDSVSDLERRACPRSIRVTSRASLPSLGHVALACSAGRRFGAKIRSAILVWKAKSIEPGCLFPSPLDSWRLCSPLLPVSLSKMVVFTHLYKKLFNKNVEPQNGQTFTNMLRTYTRLRFIQNFVSVPIFFLKREACVQYWTR